MAKYEERVPAIVGLILVFIWFAFIILIPETSLHTFAEKHLSPDGHLNPEIIMEIKRLRLLGSLLAAALSIFCLYALIKGVSVFFPLRRIDGFTGATLLVAFVFFVNLFMHLPLRSAANVVGFGFLLCFLILFHYRGRKVLDHLGSFFALFLKKKVSLPLIFLVTLLIFFKLFPPGKFNQLIFQDDYGIFLYKTTLDLECLKQGYLYGWDGAFLGGYPTFLNLRSVVFLFLPLEVIFQENLVFHLLILVNFLGFPFLVYLASRQLLGQGKQALFAAWCAVALLCGYRANILGYGMIPSFVSVNLFLLSLIFLIGLLKSKRLAGFFLALVLSLSFFVHLGHFLHIILFLLIIYLFFSLKPYKGERPHWLGMLLLAVAFLMIVSPFLSLLLRFKDYLLPTNFWSPLPGGLANIAGHLKNTLFKALPDFFWDRDFSAFHLLRFLPLAVLLSPVAFYNLKNRSSKQFLTTLLFFLLVLATLLKFIPSLELLMGRLDFLSPAILALFIGSWLFQASEKKAYFIHILSAAVFYFLIFDYAFSVPPIKHLQDIRDYHTRLVDEIQGLDGHLILLENMSAGNPKRDRGEDFEKAPRPHIHISNYIQRRTGKRFFSHPGFDPHPYHIIRDTYTVNGTYKGEDLQKMPIEEMNKILKKWGVKFLVVWSEGAKSYFGKHPPYYKMIYADSGFAVFEFLEADPRSVVTESGQGQIVQEDHFNIWLGLRGVQKGERVILRYHHFPLWRAFWQKGEKPEEIRLEDYGGQISFISPTSGDYTVHLLFPKEWWWGVLSLAGLSGLFILSLKGWNL